MKTNEAESLFEKLGGMDAVNAAVDIFYKKVLADDEINYFFTGINMQEQNVKLKTFLATAFGASFPYPGKSLKEAHTQLVRMGLTDKHFDAVKYHLISTLMDLNVPEELITEVAKIAESTRKDVLGR